MKKRQQKVKTRDNVSKILPLILISCIIQLGLMQKLNCQNTFLNVERWEKNQINSNCEPYLVEKRFYKDRTLIYLIKVNLNIKTDSIVFNYNKSNLLNRQIEYTIDNKNIVSDDYNDIEYSYNENKDLIGVNTNLKTVQKYNPKYLSLEFKNPLGLVDLELADVDLVVSNSENLPIKKQLKSGGYSLSYKSGFIVNEISRYGIPLNSILRTMNLFIKDKFIIKDEFIFDNFNLSRDYIYKDDKILKIIISLKFKKSHIKSTVFFKYK